MSNRSSSRRYDRSTFQGMSIIEGRKTDAPESKNKHGPVNKDHKHYKDRSDRRRRTSSLAQSHQIRDIIAKTVEELSRNDDGNNAETAEDILNKVLAEAKESGYSAERIFSLLSSSSINEGDETSDGRIPKETFTTGMQKLSKGVRKKINWRKEDLDAIANKFDANGDGFISLSEFQHYCYHEVPSVAWRAERQRMLNATATVSDDNSSLMSSFDIIDIKYSPGQECYRTSKIFWKINVSVEIVLRYCSELDVISIQIYNISAKEDYKTLYVNRKSCAIDEAAVKEAITVATQQADDKSPDAIKWTFYANYLVARLTVAKDENEPTGYLFSLGMLHGDSASIESDKPSNMLAPAKKYTQTNEKSKSIEELFQSKVRDLEKESRSARTSRQTAEGFIRSARNSRQTAEGARGLESIVADVLGELKLELGES